MQENRRDPLIEEALRWLVVLRSKGASDADRWAFDRWLKADPRHEVAWKKAQQTWMRVGKIGPAFKNSQPPAIDIRPPPLVAVPSMRLAPPPPRPVRRRRFLLGAAAVAAVAVPAGIVLSRPGLLADHRTGVGERRTVSLADGSTVDLAGASSFSVDFSPDLRRIVLHEGEALFTVVGDRARPFVVEAASVRTRALGTAFDVKMSGEAVTVAVTEESVEVSVDGREKVVVGKGQQVRCVRGAMGAVREADLDGVDAWRHDRLIFRDTPLGEAIADLRRYRGGVIVMTELRLRDLPVTAEFEARQADAAIDTIAASLSLRVRRLTDFLVVLSAST